MRLSSLFFFAILLKAIRVLSYVYCKSSPATTIYILEFHSKPKKVTIKYIHFRCLTASLRSLKKIHVAFGPYFICLFVVIFYVVLNVFCSHLWFSLDFQFYLKYLIISINISIEDLYILIITYSCRSGSKIDALSGEDKKRWKWPVCRISPHPH